MKLIRIIAISLAIIYAIGCIALYFGQEQLIFDPTQLSESYQFRAGKEVEVPTTNDISINCLQVKTSPSKGVVLFLHGNRGSNRRCLRQAEMFMGYGYDIFMPDYRGYGKTEGSIYSQKQLFEDVDRVYAHLKSEYREDQIIIVGYSLGSGMASYLASKHEPKHLILVAPYESFINLKNRMMPLIPNFLVKYPLNNAKHLKSVRCGITLLHGTDDEIIPYDSSVQLAKVNADLTELITLNGTGHRGSIFSQGIRRVMNRLAKT